MTRERIPFGRCLPRRSDEIEYLVEAQALRCVGARFVVDLLVDHGPVDIVGPERQELLVLHRLRNVVMW